MRHNEAELARLCTRKPALRPRCNVPMLPWRLLVVVLVAFLVGGSAVMPSVSASAVSEPMLRRVAGFHYASGTDIAFSGQYVYAASQGRAGGVHVIDVSRRVPRKVGFVSCTGTQNDVAVVRPGLLALAYHQGECRGHMVGHGVRLIDVTNPRKPRVRGAAELPGGTHTLTAYPGKPIIYASPGGLASGGGTEQILDASNPARLRVAATFQPSPLGCHDVSFFISKARKLAFCAGSSETQVWDVAQPLAPKVLAHIANPLIWFHHSTATTSDGKYLAIGDEASGAHACAGNSPAGAIWLYDISDPVQPTLAGYLGPANGREPVGALVGVGGVAGAWCTAHNFNFIPGTRTLVAAWFTGGTRVIDFSTASAPKELAHYQPSDANTWSSYWYRGRIYANDLTRGLDILELKGVKGAGR